MTAKMHSGLLLEILSRYCPEPCTILDPMGGIGTLMLAAQYGHTVIINELEPHFLETLPKSWAKIQQNGPALGCTLGSVLIIRGDARCLPIASADHIGYNVVDDVQRKTENGVFGQVARAEAGVGGIIPPTRYVTTEVSQPTGMQPEAPMVAFQGIGHPVQEQGQAGDGARRIQGRDEQQALSESSNQDMVREVYEDRPSGDSSQEPRSLRQSGGEPGGILPGVSPERAQESMVGSKEGGKAPAPLQCSCGLGKIDIVLSSPPYEGSVQGEPGIDWSKVQGRDMSKEPGNANRVFIHSGYTRPVDAVMSSPPYQDNKFVGGSYLKDKEEWFKLERARFALPTSTGSRPATNISDAALEKRYQSIVARRDGYSVAADNIGNLRGGDLYALLVYNRLRQEPNSPVEVYLCGKCLPAEIAESLLALTLPDAIAVQPSGTPRITPRSEPTLREGVSNPSAPVEPKSLGVLSNAVLVPAESQDRSQQARQNPLSGEPRLEQPIMASLSPSKQAQTTSNGREAGQDGEALLGVSNDGQCLNETTTLVQDVELRKALLSIILKMQSKLAENGITASAIWLQSAVPATIENTPSVGCLLCNASLAGLPSKQGEPMPNTVLRLRFVTLSIAPLHTIAGRPNGYWGSMNSVYQECHRVLRPGGIMALVLKGFTRNGEYVDLPQQTAALVESLGFVKFDEWRRELWSLSFWRILQRRRDPAAFDDRLNYETVLVFRKE